MQHSFAGVLEIPAAFLYISPLVQHTLYFLLDVIHAPQEFLACCPMLGNAFKVCTEMAFLAMRDGALYERKPIMKLFRGLDWMFRMQRVVWGMCIRCGGSRWRGRECETSTLHMRNARLWCGGRRARYRLFGIKLPARASETCSTMYLKMTNLEG